jgi:hypothetical protein
MSNYLKAIKVLNALRKETPSPNECNSSMREDVQLTLAAIDETINQFKLSHVVSPGQIEQCIFETCSENGERLLLLYSRILWDQLGHFMKN